jgi:hypothetical protein
VAVEKQGKGKTKKEGKTAGEPQAGAEEEGAWYFNCKCGEVCHSYENSRYHPCGQWYECTKCAVWSHVHCMLGDNVTEEQVEKMEVRRNTFFFVLQVVRVLLLEVGNMFV